MPAAARKAAINFGMVYIPVSLYTAVQEKGISLPQMECASAGRRYARIPVQKSLLPILSRATNTRAASISSFLIGIVGEVQH